MVKRTFKRTLSIFLTLVLVATTFFIFDPSVLKMDADALIGVETNAGLASLTTPQATAPETIYLKPGSNTFQYFSNINSTVGTAGGSKEVSGTVSYKNQSSTETKIFVNNLWHKVGKTGDNYEDFEISNLQLRMTGGVGEQANIVKAGLSSSSNQADINAVMASNSGKTVIGRGSNSATAVINNASVLNNTVRGDVYMIEWVVVSTINNERHLTFMYTGIYVPLLTITGATANGKHTTALTNVPKAAGFGFITGAMGYAEKGNRTTAYTGATFGVNCAPLVGFVGQQNNGSSFTIPNCNNGHSSTTSFPDSTPKTIMVVSGTYDANGNGNNYDVWTTYTSWGSYSNPVPTGNNHGDVGKNGQSDANVYAGVAYEVIDTSRFTDFSQIPNLSAGFIRYYHDRGGDLCCMRWIRCSNTPDADAPTNGVGCSGVDTNNHDDNEDSWQSRTYGLYPFAGPTPTTSKGMYVMYRYDQDITVYEYPIQLNIGVGLYIDSVNKDGLRKAYCAGINSVIDNLNASSSFSSYYTAMRTMGRRLCDPTCTDGSVVSGYSKSDIDTMNTNVVASNSGSLYFHVPETIYITPSNNNFQYYVNNKAQDTLAIVDEADRAEATSGNFYFHYKGASKVTGLYVQSVSGSGLSSMTLGGQSLSGGKINIASVEGASTANISTTITAGSLSAHSDAKLKWTLYYIDKTTNATKSVVAYTYCHVPLCNAAGNNSNSVISVTVHPGYESAWHDNTYACVTGWAAGLYSVDNSGTGSDGNGSYKRNWLYDRNSSVPTCGDKKVTVFNDGIGGSGYWSTNDNISSCTGGTGTIYIDSSRYTNVGQVPDFYVGIDLNNENGKKSRYPALYTRWSNGTEVLVAGDTSTNRSEGWSSGGVHPNAAITANTTTDQTLYIHAWVMTTGNETRTGNGHCYVNVHYRNKADLRSAYNYYLENAPILEPDLFKGTYYTDLMSYLDTVTTYLCDPENTTAQSTMDAAAKNLFDQVAQMVGAVTTTSDNVATTTTFTWYDIGGASHTGVSRGTYLNNNLTAYNYHYSTRTNALITGQGTNPESIGYMLGDTVYASSNNYQGYTFKYAEVTKPFNGQALVNSLAAKGETTNGKGTISWDSSTKTLSFASVNDTDNYNNYPGPGGDISSYYYVPVIPNTQVTISYTTTGTTAQSFAFFAGNDMKTVPSDNTGGWLMSNYQTGNVTYSATVPANCYYLTFRFGNQTANSTTKFTNIKMTFKTPVPDEINNAAGAGIEWKMYYDPTPTAVKYNPEGGTFNGTTAESSTTVYYDDVYSVGKIGTSTPSAPTKSGYNFGGWQCNANGTTYTHGDSSSTKINPWKFVEPEVTFSAKWNPIHYSIAFNGNGSTGGTAPATITGVSYDDIITLDSTYMTAFTRTGYNFAGWKVNNTGNLLTHNSDSTDTDNYQKLNLQGLTTTDNATVTLYAQWTGIDYTANVKAYSNTANGLTTWANNTTGGTVKIGTSGTAGASESKTVTCGSTYNPIATAATGYVFKGWYASAPTASTASATPLSASASYTRTMGAANETIYARFDIKQYNITFYRNQNSSDSNVVTTLTNVPYNTQQNVTIPIYTGYTCTGWWTARSGGTKVYDATSQITIKDNSATALYAQWTETVIYVQYAAGGGSGTGPANTSFNYTASFIPAANTFTAPASKIVTLKTNGGSGATDNQQLTSAYTFQNWKSSANNATYAAGTAYNDRLGASSGTVTLTAQWEQGAVNLPTLTKTGYTFKGWFTGDGGTGSPRTSGYKPTTSEILYAHFEKASYTLSLYAYTNTIENQSQYSNSSAGGTVKIGTDDTEGASAQKSFLYEAGYSAIAAAKTGYTFDGWFAQENGAISNTLVSNSATYNATMNQGSNVTLYAKFSVITCNVTAKAYSNTASAQTTWTNNTTGGTVKIGSGTPGATATGIAAMGGSVTLTATPATGYEFKGWYTSTPTTASTSEISTELTLSNISAAVTRCARFDIKSYTVKLHAMTEGTDGTYTESTTGGTVSGGTASGTSYTHGAAVSISASAKTGYTFAGWFSNAGMTSAVSSVPTTVTANIEYWAKFTANTYKITFNKNDSAATGTMSDMTGLKYGKSYSLTQNAFTKTGYDFNGWNTAANGSGTAYADKASVTSLTSTNNGTVTLYAQWKIKTYTVKLHAMTENNSSLGSFTESTTGGTVSGGTASGTLYNHGAAVTISASEETGYTFAGWFSNSGMTTAVSSVPTTVTANIEYWAKFTVNKYTITFNGNTNTGGSTAAMNDRVYGITYTLTQNGFTKTGYDFNGWNTAANGSGTAYADKASVTSLATTNGANVILYAQWKIKEYTLTLNAVTEANDGTYSLSAGGGTVKIDSGAAGATATKSLNYNTTAVITATPATGYTFDGWYKKDTTVNGSKVTAWGTAYAPTDSKSEAMTEARTYYAKFSIQQYTLKLYAYSNAAGSENYTNNATGGTVAINGGTAGATATADLNYNAKATITATPATGYTFDGWYSTVTGGNGSAVTAWGTAYAPTDSKSEAMTVARTYYAKFTLKSITVTYNANGGTDGSVTSSTAYYGETFTIGGNPTRMGYKLAGWDLSATATTPAYTTTVSDINTWVLAGAGKTLYAIWTPYQYTVDFAAANTSAADTAKYIVGTDGGTIGFKSGVTKILPGDDILSKLDIQAKEGYEFVEVRYKVGTVSAGDDVTNWSGAFSTTTTGYDTLPEFADNSHITFVAYFSIKTYTVTAYAYCNTAAATGTYNNAVTGGTVKLGNGAAGAVVTASVCYNTTTTLTATPATGYTFDGWYSTVTGGNGSAVTAWGNSFTPTDSQTAVVTAAQTYYAKFSIKKNTAYARAIYYDKGFDEAEGSGTAGVTGGTVTIAIAGSTGPTTTGAGYVSVNAAYTQRVQYTASANTGYEFIGWYLESKANDDIDILDADPIETYGTYTIVMPDKDVRIQGKFVPCNFILILDENGGVTGPTAAVTLTYGQDAILDSTAKPIKADGTFVGWAETSTATEAQYTFNGSTCTIPAATVNSWYNSLSEGSDSHIIYAVWTDAKYTVVLDFQSGKDGDDNASRSIEVTFNGDLPTAITNLPTYDGYKFKGFYSEPGGSSTQYYDENGNVVSANSKWIIAGDGVMYAKWVCPVLKNATYDETTGKWTYIYEDASDSDKTVSKTVDGTADFTKGQITDNEPSGAKEVTSVEKVRPTHVETKINEAKKIDLNHYTQTALDQLKASVTSTNTALKREKMPQANLNEYVAKMARDMEIDFAENKQAETVKPSIKLYETSDKLAVVKGDSLDDPSMSATGNTYSVPGSDDASSYVYTNKWSESQSTAADYYIYTNSLNPVIALEIDDGTVERGTSSYPTKATVEAQSTESLVPNFAEDSYSFGAVPATKDIDTAWFTQYTKANIGVGTGSDDDLVDYDYNAKTIVYLTPSFIDNGRHGTTDEIFYTITPEDDAVLANTGAQTARIADVPTSQAGSFSSFDETTQPNDKTSVTVCICYHNSMNGTSDKGGTVDDPFFQLYIDQTDLTTQDGTIAYLDTWLNQMHLYRQSGGANNWEIIEAGESVYPVVDPTFGDTGYVFGEFAYVFDASTESQAVQAAEAGDFDRAETIIINSIKNTASVKHAALIAPGNNQSFVAESYGGNGLGMMTLKGWSTNFYPKKGSYVYAHLIDRWGNEFNKVWKCFNIDDYTAVITGKAGTGFTVTESGGSNIAVMTIQSDDLQILTDVDSTFEDGVFTTSGNQFVVSTGMPKSKLPMTVTDHAGNVLKGNIPTDPNGNISFTVIDECLDLSDGAYTFMLNDIEVNLYVGEPALVRDARMPSVVAKESNAKVTVLTSDNAAKVQLVENGITRTFYKGQETAEVVDNGDGTLTWTLTLSTLSLGEHTFEVRGKDTAGKWHDSIYTADTLVISVPEEKATFISAIDSTTSYVGERAVHKVIVKEGVQAVRIMYNNGYSKTAYRADTSIESIDNGLEVWTITGGAINETGKFTVTAYAMAEGKWQKDYTVTNTITVKQKAVKSNEAVIYSVDIENSEIKAGERAQFKVVTNDLTVKLQLVLPGTTMTITADNVQVDDNGDGTLTWNFSKSFAAAGLNDIILKAKSSAGWTEEELYGTVEVTK